MVYCIAIQIINHKYIIISIAIIHDIILSN